MTGRRRHRLHTARKLLQLEKMCSRIDTQTTHAGHVVNRISIDFAVDSLSRFPFQNADRHRQTDALTDETDHSIRGKFTVI